MKKSIQVVVTVTLFTFLLLGCGESKRDKKTENKAKSKESVEVLEQKKENYKYLSDMTPIEKEGRIWKDESKEGHKITINDKFYKRGITLHSRTKITYNLNKKFDTFKAVLGHHMNYPEYKGKIKLIVYKDGKKKYESKWIAYGDEKKLSIPVEDTNKLALELKDNGKFTNFVTLGGAKLVK